MSHTIRYPVVIGRHTPKKVSLEQNFLPCLVKVHFTVPYLVIIACVAGVRRGGKREDEHAKREKIGRGRIVPSPFRAHFDFAPFLRPTTQAR